MRSNQVWLMSYIFIEMKGIEMDEIAKANILVTLTNSILSEDESAGTRKVAV